MCDSEEQFRYQILFVAAACQHAPKLANHILELLDPSHALVYQQLFCHMDQSESSRGY